MRKINYKFTVLVVLALSICIIFTFSLFENDEKARSSSTQSEIINELLYNDSIMGYNSAVWYGYYAPLGPSEDLDLPDVNNLSLPVYQYEPVEFTDKYIETTIKKFFPEINLSTMDINLSIKKGVENPYMEISNESCRIRLLRSGGVQYRSLNDYCRIEDNIGSCKNASILAFEYLKTHGGVPENISEVEGSPMIKFSYEDNSTLIGGYFVRIHRSIAGYNLDGNMLCNEITLTIDSTNLEVHDFEWHWLDLEETFSISNMTPVDEVLNYYGMSSMVPGHANVTFVEIVYQVPYTIQKGAYYTSSDIFLVAPYWMVYTDDHRVYMLGIVIPERLPIT